MVLPGWNVSEPIDFAYKLYQVVESLRSAPEGARAFVSKINNFRANLKELQRILEREPTSHEHLRTVVLECEAFVERCEEYSGGFGKLTKDGRGKMDGAGQAARWLLQEKKVARLREEIDGQMNNIGLTLAIKTLCVRSALVIYRSRLTFVSEDGRARQGSQSDMESPSAPLRSGTIASLPPYSSPRTSWTQTESLQARTPADLLGIGAEHKRKVSDTEIPNFDIGPEGSDGIGNIGSPQMSPPTLRPLAEQDELSELDSKMGPLERHRNSTSEAAVSPTGLGISSPLSEGSSAASRVFASPTISSRRTSTTDFTPSTSISDSIFAPESAVVESAMQNLRGVQAIFYQKKSRISYPVRTIESFRNKHSGRRYIIISPPITSNIKLFFGTCLSGP